MPLDFTTITRPRLLSDIVKWEHYPDFTRETAQILAGSGAVRVLTMGMLVGLITASSKIVQLAPAASDGSQNVFGVMLNDADAPNGSDSDINAAMILRRGPAIVSRSNLVLPGGITAPQTATAIAQIAALNIVLRD
jgi:hypothetical protein